ncbi:cytochrome b5 reductase 4 isoform X3 [Kryptolebias marmoratus]|uniref:cytochrome b5 reductase 4 isoform X3 n=1 Tax=Kryptolebias marmoratus TaxID=37003 RepID=UPI0007F8C72C|nr:cytochrome b5 reductase 4 isoform X3 [Kryptolebias marmoratus]
MLNIPTQSFPASSSQQRVSPSGQSGRNKVALKPGHSLMDWVRFAKSAKDLTGLKGRLIEVTQEELQKHNTRKDCWTCIRGLVYNVTPYMDYHPGGEEELMKAAGIDGTDIFDQIHRWVNYESMLKECLVGRMATKNTAAVKAIVLLPPPTGLAPPAAVAAAPNSDSQPWYDWFQTDTTVHLIIYAKRKIHSSGCMSVDLQAGVLRVEALLGKKSYMIHICLADQVEENIADTEMVRPYTPVNQTLAAASHQPAQESDLYLMIKVYPDGVFTPYLNNLQIGGHISVSGPEGTFSLRPLCDTTDLYLLAAGTGFTPMARLIHLALQEVDTIRQTKLLFFNQRQEDILWYSQLDDLATKDRRFKVEYILSEPSDNWMGRTGRVDKAVLNELLIRPDGSRCYVCVCGPSAFTELTIRLLKELGFGEDELHAFQG